MLASRVDKMSDNFRTDQWILNVFDGWFDPCPYDPRWATDGLTLDWPNKTFINPPYSSPIRWVRKAIRHYKEEGKVMVLLLKHDSSTKAWAELHEAGARFLPVMGRLKYQTGKSASFPSVLVVLSKEVRYLEGLAVEI
jgi:hypothetical protein